jgi:hypothetical protein
MTTRYQTALAFARRESASCHNARTNGYEYRLHGHVIASRPWGNLDPDLIRFDWCGWYTPSTAAHMNDILRALGVNMRVSYAQARDGKTDSVFDITILDTAL